jgi:acetyl esterase/lipase
MNNKVRITIFFVTSVIIVLTALFFSGRGINTQNDLPEPALFVTSTEILVEPTLFLPTETPEEPNDKNTLPPMDIEALRARDYPASELIIEETFDAGPNYQRFIASYMSDGSKIYGLLTIPDEQRPDGGYPTILFLHGFILPDTYVTTADYVASQDGLARNGFITYKPDLRGHGRSEGIASSAHFSEAYVVDTLNALSALEADAAVDPNRVGLWGHSNGGLLGLRAIVITDKIKASVFGQALWELS